MSHLSFTGPTGHPGFVPIVTVPPRTWAEVVAVEPRLQRIADAIPVSRYQDERRWERIKRAFFPLVGNLAPWSSPIGSDECYQIAYDELRRVFEDRSRGGCAR